MADTYTTSFRVFDLGMTPLCSRAYWMRSNGQRSRTLSTGSRFFPNFRTLPISSGNIAGLPATDFWSQTPNDLRNA